MPPYSNIARRLQVAQEVSGGTLNTWIKSEFKRENNVAWSN
jgi:hypothetical protein